VSISELVFIIDGSLVYCVKLRLIVFLSVLDDELYAYMQSMYMAL